MIIRGIDTQLLIHFIFLSVAPPVQAEGSALRYPLGGEQVRWKDAQGGSEQLIRVLSSSRVADYICMYDTTCMCFLVCGMFPMREIVPYDCSK